MRLLDLFCGAGGAAEGYARTGFEVVGVDNRKQPNYPYDFVQADALHFLDEHGTDGFDVVHASPPCQRFSKSVSKENRAKHSDLIAATRQRLRASGVPFIIENVPGAPLLEPKVMLCGSGFGLGVFRHRWFEGSVPTLVPGCSHGAYPRIYPPAWNRTTKLRVLSISGGYQKRQPAEDFMTKHMAAMGVQHPMTYDELSSAVPPAYTEFLGAHLLASVPA